MKLIQIKGRRIFKVVLLFTLMILGSGPITVKTNAKCFTTEISQFMSIASTVTNASNQSISNLSLLRYDIKKGKKTEKYPIRKGERGVKNKKYKYGDVRRYGAVGDGVRNDHDALEYALDQNKKVYLQKGKTYKCNDGFYMNNGQIIKGNGATILIDDDYTPVNDKGYKFLRNRWGKPGTTYSIYDLTITYDSDHVIKDFDGEFTLFYPYGFEKVTLNNVTIQAVDGSSRVHLMYGCSGENILENVKLINNNTSVSGGCLWLTNTTSSVATIDCRNSYFYNSSSDELLAVYGNGSARGSFTDCTFQSTNAKLKKHTLPIAIYDASNNAYSGLAQTVDIVFNQCKFIEEFDPESKYVNVCYLGVGSSNFNKFINVTLNECTMDNQNPASPFGLREYYSSLAGYEFSSNSMININKCDLKLNSSIAGTYNAWINKDTFGTAPAPSINMKDSRIDCEYAVLDLPNTQSYPVNANIENCQIKIIKAISLVKSVYRVPMAVSMVNNTFTTDQSIAEVISVYDNSHKNIPIRSIEKISMKNNVVNKVKLEDLETYTELNQ